MTKVRSLPYFAKSLADYLQIWQHICTKIPTFRYCGSGRFAITLHSAKTFYVFFKIDNKKICE